MWMRNAMRCGMRKLNQSMERAYPGPTDKIRQIPDAWWMAGCNQKYDSSQKSYLAFVWQKPQSSDASGLPRPWVSQYWLQRWQVWQQRLTTWTLGTVRLMNTGTYSRRLALDTHEQNVFLKVHLEMLICKAWSEGLITGTAWGGSIHC